MPSNVRELKAVYLSVLAFLPSIKGKSVQIQSDNITTVAYLNKIGGSSMLLSEIAADIWDLAISNNMVISAVYLAERFNSLADQLSRMNPATEWMLHPNLFQLIDQIWGPHTTDRFATKNNAQIVRTPDSAFQKLISMSIEPPLKRKK